MTRTHSGDEGFTLVEVLIAMIVMTVAVVVLVSAMSTVFIASSQHRGQAVEETLARDYAEAVQQKADFRTTLTAAISSSASSVPVANAAGFQSTTPFYVVIDQETLQVNSVSGNTLSVTRNVGGTQSTHSSGAYVTPLQRCPQATTASVDGTLAPVFSQPTNATASITSVEYWDPATQAFTSSRATCTTHFDTVCPDDIRPECEVGLERVRIHVAVAPSEATRFKNVTTDTQVLVRRGSS